MSDRHTVHTHQEYADGLLSASAKAEVERHTASCDACREDLKMFTELKLRLAAIEAPDPGDLYFDSLTEKILVRTALPSPAQTSESVIDIPAGQRIMKTLIRLAAAITLLFGSFYASGFAPEHSYDSWTDNMAQSGYQRTDPIALPDAELQIQETAGAKESDPEKEKTQK